MISSHSIAVPAAWAAGITLHAPACADDAILLASTDAELQARLSAIAHALAGAATTSTIACVHDAAAVLAHLDASRVALALVDFGALQDDGFELTRRLRRRAPWLPVVGLSDSPASSRFAEAMAAGASGYLLKERDDIEIAFSLRSALRGGMPIDPFVAHGALGWIGIARPATSANDDAAMSARNSLTRRERGILVLLASGLTNLRIAETVRLSRNTVETHIKRLYSKLDAHSRTEAVRKARLRGLIA